ncbi:hypothetical protein ACFTSD_17535 [Nocardiaceae bacterium NPDC056970]
MSVADWIQAGSSLATVVVAVVALRFAKGQVQEAANSRDQARALADEVAQPYVVAYLEPSPASEDIYDLVIKNFGSTGAADIRLWVSPTPRSAAGGGRPEHNVEIPEPIAFLAPGQEWRTFWDAGYLRERSGLPDRHEGTIGFTDSNGRRLTTPVVLDWRTMQRLWTEVKTIHDVATELSGIRDRLREFGAIRGKHIDIRTWDGETEVAREAAELAERRARVDERRAARQAQLSADAAESGSA